MQASELFDLERQGRRSSPVAPAASARLRAGARRGRCIGGAGRRRRGRGRPGGRGARRATASSAIGVAVDVRELASAQSMARAAVEAFGGIDILVNNAAIMTDLPRYGLSNMPVDEWDRVHRRQPPRTAALHAGGAAVHDRAGRGQDHQRPLRRRVQPQAASTGSPSTRCTRSPRTSPASSAPRGINVNAIAPGLVAAESGYVSLAEDSPIRSAIEAGIPGKKSGPPEDLVGTLLLLCSKAGDWINGQTSASTAAGSCGSDAHDLDRACDDYRARRPGPTDRHSRVATLHLMPRPAPAADRPRLESRARIPALGRMGPETSSHPTALRARAGSVLHGAATEDLRSSTREPLVE